MRDRRSLLSEHTEGQGFQMLSRVGRKESRSACFGFSDGAL